MSPAHWHDFSIVTDGRDFFIFQRKWKFRSSLKRILSMRPSFRFTFLSVCAALLTNAHHSRATEIFDGKTLSGWYMYLKEGGKVSGESTACTVSDGIIRISGKTLGYLSTQQEYSDYKFTFSYRWAETQETNVTRNSGLIYHAIGEDRMWCNGMEFQMQQGDAGDLWLIPGSNANAAISVLGKEYGGVMRGTRITKSEAGEKPLGEWNEMTLICRGKEFEHWVNGKKVLAGSTKDRTQGKIQFQFEGHEVWIRDIKLTQFGTSP
jgi:hypothetical protein